MFKKAEWNTLLRLAVVIVSSLIALGSMYLSFYLRFAGNIPYRNYSAFQANYLWIVVGFIVINFLFGTYVFYNKNLLDLFYFTMLSELALTCYIMVLIYARSRLTFPRSVLLINFVLGTFILFIYNGIVYMIYQKVRGHKRVMIVGENERVLEAVRNFDAMKNQRHQVTHVILSNYLSNIKAYASEVDIVYMTGQIDEAVRTKVYEYLMQESKKLFLSSEFEQLMMLNANVMNFDDESVLEISNFEINPEEAVLKRAFDVIVSVALLIVTSPIMLITAILIKLDSPGPIFYKQERITKGGRHFNILKFRSMSATAERESGPVLATKDDARITRVGRFIRSTRIDELPQLINVLKGDMSLVGPRPERPFFVKQYAEQNPYYTLRHNVQAGITGYAQVYGKYSSDFNRKLNFDLLYIKNYSLAFDFKLLFRTTKILFDKVSSRGFEEEVERVEDEWQDYEDQMTIIK